MILISNVRTPASKKINLMALIRTLTISTTTFERTKEKFDGFRQNDEGDRYTGCLNKSDRVCFFLGGGGVQSVLGCHDTILEKTP